MQQKKTKKVVEVTIPGNQGAQVVAYDKEEKEESGVVEDDDLFDAVFDDPDPFPENESNNIGSTAVGLSTNPFFSVSFWYKIIDLLGGQTPRLGTLFSCVPPNNSLVCTWHP